MAPSVTPIGSIFLDYDGTISPLGVSRENAVVPNEIKMRLEIVSKKIPVVIVTSKDSSFVVPRTQFAFAWSTICGLENRVENKISDKPIPRSKLEALKAAMTRVQSGLGKNMFTLEEKRNSSGEIVAFCVDWCQCKAPETAKKVAEAYASDFEKMKLNVVRSYGNLFLDVFAYFVDKGSAIRTIMKELPLTRCSMFLGDSQMDNPAFRISDVSIGVVHDSTIAEDLDCTYLVKFESVASFLAELEENNLVFSPKFSTIKLNSRGSGG